MKTVTSPPTVAPQPGGIVVRSSVKAGRLAVNHSEGVAPTAGEAAGTK